MSARRFVAAALALAAIGAVALWHHGRGGDDDAHILLLDPATGRTLHEHAVSGGYAVVALLGDGRIAVASLDSCPAGDGGRIDVFDRSLAHVVSSRAVPPCLVARMDANQLRARFEHSTAPAPDDNGGRDVTVGMGRGRLVETYQQRNGLYWLHGLTARDAGGAVAWRRSFGRIGVADWRAGRLVLPSFGTFTPGSD